MSALMARDPSQRQLIARHAMKELRNLASERRVILINGPRQAGKTTLLKFLHADLGGTFRNLDNTDQLQIARSDPRGYLQGLRPPVFLDEVQRVGDPLILEVKIVVDQSDAFGQFVLSGSTRFLTVPTISESLAGRVAILDLMPLSAAERAGTENDLIDQMFTAPASFLDTQPAEVTRHEYFQVVCAGGFPEALRLRAGKPRNRWYDDYVQTVTQRDVLELKRVGDVSRLERMVDFLAAMTAQELNVAEAGRVLNADVRTVQSDVALLETVYLAHRLPAWSRNLTKRVVQRPKLHLIDSGLAASLRNESPQRMAQPGYSGGGAVLETFVVNELIKLRQLTDYLVRIYHYRDRNKQEIDIILETRDGSVVAIEVKSAATVNQADFRPMANLRDTLGDKFIAGYLLNTGPVPLPYGDRLYALPINLLWGGEPAASVL